MRCNKVADGGRLSRSRGALAPRFLTLLVALLVALALPGCALSGGSSTQTLNLLTVFPLTGVDGALGLAMQRGVDLAVHQNASLGGGYQLAVSHIDESLGSASQVVAADIAEGQLVGVVGPFSSETALSIAPVVARAGVVTISPSATLPGLTLAASAKAEGLTFTQIHPQGAPIAFLRLPQNSDAEGKAAADLAAGPGPKGFSLTTFYVVDDGTVSGKALAAAFTAELNARHGAVWGHTSLAGGVLGNPGALVAAIVQAEPQGVFYAGNTEAGAQLRYALSSSGAPGMPLVTAGASADNPGWVDAVSDPLFSGATVGVLPARDLSTLAGAQAFASAYQVAYSGAAPPPQAALAYDAAMDEIAAIKAIIKAGKSPTASAVLGGVTGATYHGVTGDIAFDKNGDNTVHIPFSVYTCGANGVWKYRGAA